MSSLTSPFIENYDPSYPSIFGLHLALLGEWLTKTQKQMKPRGRTAFFQNLVALTCVHLPL